MDVDVEEETGIAARARELLREALGPDAAFRDGQLEAIDGLVRRRARMLVVQRTGWGKSSVYFIATRLLHEAGAGPVLLVSPLLALMRDQVRAAERLGVAAASIDSTNMDQWDGIAAGVRDGFVDLLLVSPERLASRSFRDRVLVPLLPRIGMLVVDEAHCISDWGHDFRPDYRRIRALVGELPPETPVLATTATANEAVARDVVDQLGADGPLELHRGPLARASLRLDAINIPSEHDRMAWLAAHLPEIEGSGIVYVLTKAHAARVAAFLAANGVDAESYTGGGRGAAEDARKLELERRLLANDVKALVATPALGMGFDKPDLGFVVHFSMPQSLVHYYQQVGRAGRSVDDAVGVLLHGDGDQRITDYFIAQAFPPRGAFEAVIASLGAFGDVGATTTEIAKHARVGRALTDKILAQLSVDVGAPASQVGQRWFATGAPWSFDAGHMQELTQRRRDEYERMQRYAAGERCFMATIARELDDPTATPCGRCSVCTGEAVVSRDVPADLAAAAATFTTPVTRRPRRRRPPKTTARVKRRRRRS